MDSQQHPIKITVANGPGEVIGQGAVKPKASAEKVKISVLLPRRFARKMALAVISPIQAWAAATYYTCIAEKTYQPPTTRIVDTETGEIIEQPATEETPAVEQATASYFYAVANEALQAGVTHAEIQAIAGSASGTGWADTIGNLKVLIRSTKVDADP